MDIANIISRRQAREKYLKMLMVKILYKAEKHDIKQGLYSNKNIFEKD